MKQLFILTVAFFISALSFAQKKEIKAVEKAIKANDFPQAQELITDLSPMLMSMDEKTKVKYLFNKGKAYYANGKGSSKDIMTAINSFNNIKNGAYAKEILALKGAMQNDLLVKANELYQGKKYKEASASFSNLYNVVPKDTTYLYYAAVSAVSAEDYDTALSYYSKLKKIGYTGIEKQFYATNKASGKEEIMQKNQRDLYVKAGSHINPGERTSETKVPEITKNIALIYVNQGESEKALAAIKEARVKNPTDVNLIINEANVQYKLGNKEKYSELIKEATEKDPNNADLLYNLGVISNDTGNPEAAKAYYKKAIEIDGSYTNAYTNLSALILAGEKAIVEKMNGLGNSSRDNKLYDTLKAKRTALYKEAIPYLEKVLEFDSKNMDVANTLINIYSIVGEYAKLKVLKEKFN